ncbi:DUF1015 family protein [Opitutia bacterium ISCC 51]|nr:DUF1015 family protein [Opitutae bacterium ISCC 51]QXD29059.1 DUF1015 family protein [Opitutae bacterium ISCC 52]
MKIRAFKGLRPDPQHAAKVASLPYDVVNTSEARELAQGNPHSFLHVVRAEIDLPEGTDLYSDPVYTKAKENLDQLKATGAIVREEAPSLYVYQQVMDGHKQKGLVSVCHIEDYLNDLIKKHEKTRPQKEDDRTKLNATLNAHPGPVFLTYRDEATINESIDQITQEEPLIDFTAPDGVQHTVWRVAQTEALVSAFADIPFSYVADGHHRSASAARVGAERKANNPNHTGEEDYNWFLAVNFPASQLKILPYNRLVFDLNGHSEEDFLERVKSVATVTEDVDPSPNQVGKVSMYFNNRWYGLEFAPDESLDPVSRLDISRLQDSILSPILGIEDPRTSDRIDFIGGIRGTEELEKRVHNGDGPVAFSMYPVTIGQLMDIADAGATMPPKSTWFEPKLRSGLFVHTI